MRPFSKILALLRRAVHLCFRSQLRLTLRGGLRLALADDPADRPVAAADLAADRARRDLDRILEELNRVLDETPDIRDSLRHLGFVEQCLREQGLAALQQIPLGVLQRALAQFEGLVSNWAPRGLADLRSKMAVVVTEREARTEDPGRPVTTPAARALTADGG